MANKNGGFIGTDGLDAPDPPTAVTPTAGDAEVSVTFTAPTDTGTSAITGFVAQVSTDGTNYSGGSGTGTSSPITVSSLTNGTSYTAKVWAINAYGTSAPSDASSSFSPVEAVHVLVAGLGDFTNAIDRFNINASSDATDFGDMTVARSAGAVIGGSTRTIFCGGRDGSSQYNTMDFVNPASAGNATDFGDMTAAKQIPAASGSSTRGLLAGGEGGGSTNVIEFITIASAGNASDFGDLDEPLIMVAGLSSPTRSVTTGGGSNNGSYRNTIQYVTIASAGNASDFGDLTEGKSNHASCSNSTRGLTAAGFNGSSHSNVIDYITIASTGNATDFGDLTSTLGNLTRGAASSTKAIFFKSRTNMNIVTIATTGNGTDFIDLTTAPQALGPMAGSNGHGGLS